MVSESAARTAERKVYRVSELAHRVKALLEGEIGAVWVEGEVSGFKQVASGHMYFDLKDETALINCCLFRGNQRGLQVAPANGLKMRVFGEITSYPPRSSYQIIVRKLEPAGQGSLQEAFEKLKAKLASEGLFDPARKRPLPVLPRTIAIVTSPTGAVIRDILNILNRRYPDRHVLVAPVRVQGAGAAEEIAAALDLLNARGGIDVIIVARGGGSLEDLWAFNEEMTARAVARSRIPVISAVGHETDFTICDFVADKRASTPSEAAEIVIQPKSQFQAQVAELRRKLAHALRHRVLELRARFTRAARSYVFREPAHLLARHRERVARGRETARRALESAVFQRRQRADEAALRLAHGMQLHTQRARHRLDRIRHTLRALDPRAVLARGYSVTLDPDGHAVTDAARIPAGTRIRTLLAKGQLLSETIAQSGAAP
jgi:exodeoxyribonuclease VII large subunit